MQSLVWLKVLTDFIKLLRIDSKEIAADDPRGSKLDLWQSQKIVLESICRGIDNGVRTFYILKARQLGVTTISLVFDVFWMAMYPGTIGALVADTPKNSSANRELIKRYIKSVPPGFFGKSFTLVKDNREFMLFSNGSRLDLLVAGTRAKKAWGEGVGYSFAHLCAAKGTPVVLEHGRIRAIEDVKIGDKVLTHTGKEANVIDVFGQPGKDKPMVEVTPWLGQAIKYTIWHKIPTARGLVQAGELRKDDLLIMPIRKITDEIKTQQLQNRGFVERINYFGRGNKIVTKDTPGAIKRITKAWKTVASNIDHTMVLNEEFGFAIGYYLAEGYLIKDRFFSKRLQLFNI